MTRLPVNLKRNNYYDSEQLDESDLKTEQNYVIGINSALENNFFGSGVLPEFVTKNIIIDTDNLNNQQTSLVDGYSFDGQNVYIGDNLNDVSDKVYGMQLSVTISNTILTGASKYIKVSIIGDSFGDYLIHDDLTFYKNCKQITRGRYKKIRAIFFNNFAGNLNGSYDFAYDGYDFVGRCVIEEAHSLETSVDSVVAQQISQPSIYWNTFKPYDSTKNVIDILNDALEPSKSASDLNISLNSISKRQLIKNDVTTKISQKFKASGSNIQKISILLSVLPDESVPLEDAYDWSGSVSLTIHKLQTEVSCPVSPTPDNLIDFDPDPSIIAQMSINYDDLRYQGVILNDIPQKVGFVFSDTLLADPARTPIIENNYYILTIGRTGNSSTGVLLIEEAADIYENGYEVIYDGTQWINLYENDLWFSIEGDYIKTADGIAYEEGIGVQVPKVDFNNEGVEEPYVNGLLSLYTISRNANNYLLVESTNKFSSQEQDQRTGNLVYSRVSSSPEFSVINNSSLNSILQFNPVLLSYINDLNPRQNTRQIFGETSLPGLVYENRFDIINPNADLKQNNLINSILFPSTSCGGLNCEFRIEEQTLYLDSYGDINGDGVVDLNDLAIINDWLLLYGTIDINDTSQHHLFYDGLVDVRQFLRADVNNDGIVNTVDRGLIEQYINKEILSFPAGSTFERMELIVETIVDPLNTEANIPNSCCSVFKSSITSPISWRIDYFASWVSDNIFISDLRRFLPTTFTNDVSENNLSGRNDFYIPGNLLLDGYILNPDETFYKIDFEETSIILNIPVTDSYGNPLFLDGYKGILVFDTFIAESSNGKTPFGFQALKYSDGTYVQLSDYSQNKVKISASLQSHANSYTLGNINDIVGMYFDPSSSLIMLYLKDLYDGYGGLIPSISTKIIIDVYLKKSCFVNQIQEVPEEQIKKLFNV